MTKFLHKQRQGLQQNTQFQCRQFHNHVFVFFCKCVLNMKSIILRHFTARKRIGLIYSTHLQKNEKTIVKLCSKIQKTTNFFGLFQKISLVRLTVCCIHTVKGIYHNGNINNLKFLRFSSRLTFFVLLIMTTNLTTFT